MGLLNDLESRLEQEMPRRLQESLQRAWDDYRAQCAPCGLMMHRHRRHPRSIHDRIWRGPAADTGISLWPVPGDEQQDGVAGR